MHNCKTTRERLTELLLDGSDPRIVLAAELRACVDCRQEFRALKETLALTTRFIETTTPPDNYWPGYHARLREKLQAAQPPRTEPGHYQPGHYQPVGHPRSWIKQIFLSSIRVPVPVGLAVLVVLGLLIFRTPAPAETQIVRVPVEVPVEVPVIQEKEKIVERIVYRDRSSRGPKTTLVSADNNSDSVIAKLKGFQPAEEVKLTVIKGGSPDEK